MKPCLKTAAAREQKNAGRGGFVFSFSTFLALKVEHVLEAF
jgi:hypothetical protein